MPLPPYPLCFSVPHQKAPIMTSRDRELLVPKAARCSFGGSFYLPHILLSVPLIPWENEFAGENADGQGGVQCKTKKSRRAGTKTILLDLRFGQSSAHPLIILTVSVAYTCPCCSGGSQGPCKSSSFRRPQMHFLWDLVQKSWLLW